MKKSKKLLIVANISFAFLLFLALPAFAVEDEAGWGVNWNNIYSIIKALAIPIATLSCAYGGLLLIGVPFLGGQKSKESGMAIGVKTITVTLIGMAAIFLMPQVVNLADATFSRYAWNPEIPENINQPYIWGVQNNGVFDGANEQNSVTIVDNNGNQTGNLQMWLVPNGMKYVSATVTSGFAVIQGQVVKAGLYVTSEPRAGDQIFSSNYVYTLISSGGSFYWKAELIDGCERGNGPYAGTPRGFEIREV